MANMSKEFVATLITMITGFIAILAFLWAISSEIGEIKGELGVLSGMVNANSDGIAELRDDARELRGLLITHIAEHSHVAQSDVVVEAGNNDSELLNSEK